jgi:hypothetical protein
MVAKETAPLQLRTIVLEHIKKPAQRKIKSDSKGLFNPSESLKHLSSRRSISKLTEDSPTNRIFCNILVFNMKK